MPYRVPACATSRIGISTMTLPVKTVSTDCHQFIPSEIMPLASEYVGMHKHMPIHNEAKRFAPQSCSARVQGRRSSFHSSALPATAAAPVGVSVTMPLSRSWVAATTLDLDHLAVRLGAPIAVELPGVAHLFDHAPIHVADDDFILVAAADGHEL